jgi:hypothetical protein
MSREDPQIKLRLTEAMKSIVIASARANRRSVNTEIVIALEKHYPKIFDHQQSVPEVPDISTEDIEHRRLFLVNTISNEGGGQLPVSVVLMMADIMIKHGV